MKTKQNRRRARQQRTGWDVTAPIIAFMVFLVVMVVVSGVRSGAFVAARSIPAVHRQMVVPPTPVADAPELPADSQPRAE